MWSTVFVGLGNPGRTYEGTRHNLGFDVIDALAEQSRCDLKPGKGDYLMGSTTIGNTSVCLVKPLTYMNNSGLAVLDIVNRFTFPAQNICVVCDDFQLPLGQLRIRARGSDGGHNGLASIIYHLQSEEFARLRCGIGGTSFHAGEDVTSFVLSQFERSEIPAVRDMTLRARDACMAVVHDGLDKAMNKFNIRLGDS